MPKNMPKNLKKLLHPRHIAFIGGSQLAGPISACQRAGYQGQIWAVNPINDLIGNIKTVANIQQLPQAPDAAVIGVSPERSIHAIQELSAMKAGGAMVMSAGFAEQDEQGKKRQTRLLTAAGDMPFIGPNCMGILNQFDGAAVWGGDNFIHPVVGDAAALISQSGALLIGITNIELAFPLGYAISTGNQASVDIADCILALLDDPRIKVIGLYIEGINDGISFGIACQEAKEKGVPIIVLKGGDELIGAMVATSHTASMIVARDLWDAFVRRYRLIEVSSPKTLVESLKLLTIGGVAKGNKVGIISYSGGANGLAATRLSKMGLQIPQLSNKAKLAEIMPDTVALQNPLDLNIPFKSSKGISMEDTDLVAKAIILFAENIADQLVFLIDVPRAGIGDLDKIWCESLNAMIPAQKKLQIPTIVAAILPEGLPPDFRQHLHDHQVSALSGFSETIEAIALNASLALAPNYDAKLLLSGDELSGAYMLDEAKSKQALQEYGLQIPDFRLATPNNVAKQGKQLGFPVAVKLLSDTIAHKARIGGVVLGVNDQQAAMNAGALICANIAKAKTGHKVEKLLVESMIEQSRTEMIIGVKRDVALGLVMMLGKGGVDVEENAQFKTLLLPLIEQEMLDLLMVFHLADHHGFIQAIKAVASYAEAMAETLITLDVNPIILTDNDAAIAADALIILGK